MGWIIKIDTVTYADAVFDHIEENLNGHLEAAFTLPNTVTNRTLVNTDHDVEILYDTSSEFKGKLRAPEFQQSGLLCKCYQTCLEQMQRRVHSGNYPDIAPNVVLQAIASSAGVLGGVCPTTPLISVRYDKAYCYDAARYVAWVLGKDLYPDFSGASPRINIGTAGTGYPAGRGVLQYLTVPKRTKDRAKKRDKVYVRGLDTSGLPLVGEAGTGIEVAVFTDRTCTSQVTINALAAKYLADLNTEASGCVVPVALESPVVVPAYVQGYDIHAGDYVILTCAELDYSSTVVRVKKVTKTLLDVTVEVERAEMLLDDYLEAVEQWESLGIYGPTAQPDIDPVTPSGFGTDDVVPASIQNADGTFVTLFAVTVHRVAGMSGYKVRWQKQGESVWNYVEVEQPLSGDAVLYTGPVAMGTTYDLQVASYNRDAKVSAYTASVAKTATTDTTATSVPTGVAATTSGLVRAIKVSWTAVTSADLKGYKVYRNTTNTPGTATEIARTGATVIIIDTDLVTPYYFWVSSYDFIGNESAKSTLATGCPVTGQKEVITDVTDVAPAVPVITCAAKEIDTAAEHRTWLQVTIARVTNAGGYVVSYRKTADPEWIHFYVEQPPSGNPIAVTPDLVANTTYNIHACSVSQKGQSSAWSDTFTFITCAGTTLYNQTVATTCENTTAPPVPTGLAPTAVVDGVLLEWNSVAATDLSHYRVYYGTTNPPLIVAGQASRPYYLWKKKTTETYVLYYFAITAVDSAGNESAKCTAVSTTPLQVKPIDLSIESRPWTADFKMWEDLTTPTYGKLYWSAKDGASDGTVKFADGSTRTITKNLTGTSYVVGIRYFYWDTVDNTLKNTTDFGAAVGEGKGLIVVVDVRTDRTSTILHFDSYAPTIGAGCIAAKTILTDHIKAGQITTSLVVSGDATLGIRASQIVLDGSVYFVNSWAKSGDVTKIDGGKISTGTVLSDQIGGGQVVVSKLGTDALARMLDTETIKNTIQNWRSGLDLTLIDGGDIYTGSVHTAQILFDILTSDPTYAAGKMWWIKTATTDQLRFSSGTTLADVAIIPKYPLFDIQAPPENMIPNQAFEFDRDGDGVPDFWTKSYQTGSSSFAWSTAYSWKGQHSLKLLCAVGGYLTFDSVWIPILPSKTYFFGVDIYAGTTATLAHPVGVVEFWNADKSAAVGSIALPYGVSTGWNHLSAEGTTPSTARWALIKLELWNPSVVLVLYYDNVVLSEMRAAVPTAGVVAAATVIAGSWISCTANVWIEMISLTVANVAMEVLFANALVQHLTDTVAGYLRLKKDSTYYPSVNGTFISGTKSGQTMITIPENVANQIVKLEYKALNTGNYMGNLNVWGHSPHSHR